MASSRRGGRSRITIGLLLLSAVLLLTLDGRGSGPLDSVRSSVLTVLSPLGEAATAVASPFRNVWDSAFDQNDLKKENDLLREENDRLKGDITANSIAKEQLQQLLQLVGIPFVGDTPVVHTRVISGAVGNFGDRIELDKGSSSGIERNMPVVTGQGLIGKVVEVGENRSVVALLSSGTFRVGFSVVGTAAIGIAQGTGSYGSLRGTNIDSRQAVTVGAITATSGLAGSPFPPNLPIGTITAVRTNEAALESTVDISMFANLNDLVYADVVLWKPAS
jgi:rod shape-determining protein MreC